MAIEDVQFEGIMLYANLPPRAPAKGYQTEDTNYSVLIECSKEQFRELKKAGIAAGTKLKDFEDFTDKDGNALNVLGAEGKSFIALKSKKNPSEDDVAVATEDGEEVTVSVANGSKGRVNALLIDVNNQFCKKVLRLQSVVVTNLIEFESGDDIDGTSRAGKLAKLGVKAKEKTQARASEIINSDDSFLGA